MKKVHSDFLWRESKGSYTPLKKLSSLYLLMIIPLLIDCCRSNTRTIVYDSYYYPEEYIKKALSNIIEELQSRPPIRKQGSTLEHLVTLVQEIK